MPVKGYKVSTHHPDYDANLKKWKRCRDCVDGEDAVKAAEDTYLPRLSDQSDDEYKLYKMRANFFGATDRTVKGLVGMVFRKAIEKSVPTEMDELLKSIGINGEDFDQLAKHAVQEVLTTARIGLLVDSAQDSPDLPYFNYYCAENIVNWRTEMIDGEQTLTMVVLREWIDIPDEADPFVVETEERYRVLNLKATDTGWIYYQQLYKRAKELENEENAQRTKEEANLWVEDGGPIVPAGRGGLPLNRIPFLFITPTRIGEAVDKPPILDLANVNLSHYRSSADHEWGLHYTALPTPVIIGVDKNTRLKIGSSIAWVLPDMDAEAKMLEFTGAGLQSIERALDKKEKLMATLGSRLLETQKVAAEAADAVRLRQAGEQSVLGNIAITVSEALTRALKIVAEWLRLSPGDVKVKLNQDYVNIKIEPNMLVAMLQAVQAGRMSQNLFFYNLEKGELTPDNWTLDDEVKAIQDGAGETGPTVVEPEEDDDDAPGDGE